MRKCTHVVISMLVAFIGINVTVYAGVDSSKVVNALQKLPYLYEFIQEFFVIDNTFSIVLFKLVRIFAEFILGVIIISVNKNFICQEAMSVSKEIKKSLFLGIAMYALIVTLLVLFFVSVIGFPIGVIILVLTYILVLIGKTALAVFVGHFIEIKLKQGWHIYLDYLIGGIIIELLGFIPLIGNIFLLGIVPIISIGIFIVVILNKYIYKIYYNNLLVHGIPEKKYNKKDIREIISRGIDK